jgi:hypothetical protein
MGLRYRCTVQVREPILERLARSAPDEVDDFEAVSVVELGLWPSVPRNDVAVQLDGDAIGLHSQRFDESAEGSGGMILRLAVDDEIHVNELSHGGPAPLFHTTKIPLGGAPSFLQVYALGSNRPDSQLRRAELKFSSGCTPLKAGLNQHGCVSE